MNARTDIRALSPTAALRLERIRRALKLDMSDAESTLTDLATRGVRRSAAIVEFEKLLRRRTSSRKRTIVNWDERCLWIRHEGPGIPPGMMVMYGLGFDRNGRLVGWGRESGSPPKHRRKIFARDKKAEAVVERTLSELMRF